MQEEEDAENTNGGAGDGARCGKVRGHVPFDQSGLAGQGR